MQALQSFKWPSVPEQVKSAVFKGDSGKKNRELRSAGFNGQP